MPGSHGHRVSSWAASGAELPDLALAWPTANWQRDEMEKYRATSSTLHRLGRPITTTHSRRSQDGWQETNTCQGSSCCIQHIIDDHVSSCNLPVVLRLQATRSSFNFFASMATFEVPDPIPQTGSLAYDSLAQSSSASPPHCAEWQAREKADCHPVWRDESTRSSHSWTA